MRPIKLLFKWYRTFEVAVLIDDEEIVRAVGRSKKQAEQEASRLALEKWKT